MKVRSPFFAACCFAATALCLSLTGCNSRENRAQAAYEEFQSAAAAGDLPAQRKALLMLVAADDSNPTYWAELGRVQVQLAAYSDAYYAYSRAWELDRSDPMALSTLTQLSLLSGNVDKAEDHARKLELLSPGHPAIRLTYGYVALKRGALDEADRQVDLLLQEFPREPSGNLLKARVFLARDKPKEAIGVLENQVRSSPRDIGSWKGLVALHERDRNWPAVAQAASQLAAIHPKDVENQYTAIEAALRSNKVDAALQNSQRFLSPEAPPDQLSEVLSIWADRWKTPDAIDRVRRLARDAGPQQSLAYATYFNAVGAPDDAAALLGGSPRLPLDGSNLSLNALMAESLALRGQNSEAKELFDGILAIEPDHVYALRGRINLEIRTRAAKAAIIDAQRLVSVVPKSARDRLLLAKAFAAAGDARQVDRTLWDAFHEIPANLLLYETLRAHVQRSGGEQAVTRVDAEFRQQQDTALSRAFI